MECQDQNLSGSPEQKLDAEENGFEWLEERDMDFGFEYRGLRQIDGGMGRIGNLGDR